MKRGLIQCATAVCNGILSRIVRRLVVSYRVRRRLVCRQKVLNTARDESGTSAQVSLNERNAVKAMADAGSKGSFINISQVGGWVYAWVGW